MAGLKISELPPHPYPVDNDILVIVNDNDTKHTTVRQLLDILKPFEIKSFGVTPAVVPVGTSIASVLLSWQLSKAAASITISNIETVTPTDTTAVFNSPITSTTTFIITATSNDGSTATRTASISFNHYRYWGTTTNPTPDTAAVLALNSDLGTSKSKSVTYDCSGGKYFVWSYPKSFGMLSNTRVNNFPWNDWVLSEIEINGITYYVFRSYNLLYGSTIPVEWN